MAVDSPRGRFITIEGIEGVGKSTNLAWVAERLRKQGLEVVTTREPGGTPLAELVRGLLLDSARGSVPETSELLLMFAARASHLQGLIGPALARGAWVVCDRFTDATYAYQGTGRGMNADWIGALEQMVQGDLRPDLTLLLDATPALTRERRHARGVMDRFEAEDEAFFERVASGYRERAAADAPRFRVIDASLPLPAVQTALGKALDSYLESI